MSSPLPREITEARSNPGGWVYRIAGTFGPSDAIPPEAIVGAWKVDDQGCITATSLPTANMMPIAGLLGRSELPLLREF